LRLPGRIVALIFVDLAVVDAQVLCPDVGRLYLAGQGAKN
jgi:hypothetical protein